MITKDFLEHYGTKGMKWGVRKKPGSGVKTSAAKKPKAKASAPAPQKTKTGRGTKTKGLSDTELKARVNRLNMEKQYKTLKSENASVISRGAKATKKIVSSSAKTALSNYLTNTVFRNVIERAGKAARAPGSS